LDVTENKPDDVNYEATMTLPFGQLSFPEMYEQELVGPVFRPWAGPLLEDAELAPGDRVLDVACGTGIVARTAKERLGHTSTVVGVDINPGMLAVARRVAPNIDWREGDACALPLGESEQFDVVVCQQGLQFVPDKPAAVRQMRRALAAGGRLALSAWNPDENFPVLLELRRIAERRVGPIVDRRHSLGQTELQSLIRDAGFREVRSKKSSRTIRFDDGPLFVRMNAMALVGMSAASKELNDENRAQVVQAITRDSDEVVRANTDEQGFAYEIGTSVVTARN
jgi:ubiquinone/menaquinone biosynthesis C-methylase UbiE